MGSYNKSSKSKHTTKPKWYTIIVLGEEDVMDYEIAKELMVKHLKTESIVGGFGNYIFKKCKEYILSLSQ